MKMTAEHIYWSTILAVIVGLLSTGCDGCTTSAEATPFTTTQALELPFAEGHRGFSGALVSNKAGNHVYILDEGHQRGYDEHYGQWYIFTVVSSADGDFEILETLRSDEHFKAIHGALLSNDEQRLYVFDADKPALAVFSRDQDSGELSAQETIELPKSDLPFAPKLMQMPQRQDVYLMGNDKDALVVSWDEETKSHKILDRKYSRGLRGERMVSATEGPFRYINPSWRDAEIKVLEETEREVSSQRFRSYMTRQTVDLDAEFSIRMVALIALSPDENHFYVVGNRDNQASVIAFSRDSETGHLEDPQVTALRNHIGIGDFDLFDFITFSPSGEHLFLSHKGLFYTFERDPKSGAINRVLLGDEEVHGHPVSLGINHNPTRSGASHAVFLPHLSRAYGIRYDKEFIAVELPGEDKIKEFKASTE